MSIVRNEVNPSLPIAEILEKNDYALALSPGFFFMYAHTGFLCALDEMRALKRVTHISGTSAGAIAGGFFASGMSTEYMMSALFELRREDMWDIGGVAGLLKGQLMQSQLEKRLLVKNIEECKIPLGVTAYDVLRFETQCLIKGDLASSIRASCCVPLLFQPVMVNGWPYVDGGTFDWNGAMALPGVPSSNLVVNVLCGRSQLLKTPLASNPALRHRTDIKVISLVYENIPRVSPFSMQTTGPLAFEAARQVTRRVLSQTTWAMLQEHGPNHWFVVIDGNLMTQVSLEPTTRTVEEEPKKKKSRRRGGSEADGSNVLAVTRSSVRLKKRRQCRNRNSKKSGQL